MDDLWLIVIAVAVAVILLAVAWVAIRRRSRAGGVIATGTAGPAAPSDGARSAKRTKR